MKRTIKEQEAQQRLDHWLAKRYPQVTRSFLQSLIESGRILVNQETQKTGYKLRTGDVVVVDYDFAEKHEVEIELPIIYQDEDCIVVNKPSGVLTHSKGAFNPEGTVASFVRPKLKGEEGDRAGIVHRLDRATSGVLITARTPEAMHWLQKQFSSRKVKKTYYAVVEGTPELAKALIEVPIERNPRDPKTFRPGSSGKPAVTEYEVVGSGNGYSLLRLQPTTGRTHQLRVHLKFIGHPIVGDVIYEGEKGKRLLLHAENLELTLPNKERKSFTAPLPDEFHAILK